MPKHVALYVRCSTEEQTTENQIHELRVVAERHGWIVSDVFDDAGISGGVAREDRPAMKRLLRAVARREVDMVAAWSVDRLGRSLLDLLGFLAELHSKKVGLYLHQQGLDTSTPAGRAMFQMLGLFAEFERAMTKERVLSGMARARTSGTKSGKAIGRPAVEDSTKVKVRALLNAGHSEREVSRLVGVGKGTVSRLRAELVQPGWTRAFHRAGGVRPLRPPMGPNPSLSLPCQPAQLAIRAQMALSFDSSGNHEIVSEAPATAFRHPQNGRIPVRARASSRRRRFT